MTDLIKEKLARLPTSPGVYFHKNLASQIIYVGKAAVLKNRVRQYFQASRLRDPKTDLLISEIADIDWIELQSEADALFLEAEMVRRYLPKYNILLRDDKSNAYIRIDLKAKAPSVTVTRRPLDDGAEYFGPFLSAGPLRKALRYLRKIFPYSTHITLPPRACLQYHLGLCPGPETDLYNRQEDLRNLKNLILYIQGQRERVTKKIEKEMKTYAAKQDFEQAAFLRNRLRALKMLQSQIIFGDSESLDLSKDHALADIYDLLSLEKPPRRIEGFDISHLQGTDTVASMVVFSNGAVDKKSYRKFKMQKAGNDDFVHIYEVVGRRFKAENISKWGRPDLIIIDGGKGQLAAAIKSMSEKNIKIPVIGLAKKHEEIIVSKSGSRVTINIQAMQKMKGFKNESDDFVVIDLPDTSHVVKLLQRIRDESHRFAVSYHTSLKLKRQSASVLDDIPGIGPTTKKKLLRKFGSVRGLESADSSEITKLIGRSRAEKLKLYLSK